MRDMTVVSRPDRQAGTQRAGRPGRSPGLGFVKYFGVMCQGTFAGSPARVSCRASLPTFGSACCYRGSPTRRVPPYKSSSRIRADSNR